ncbi:hypothetical protein IQ07DRAFT_361496 [Pyrenochaeta sp. DS3sAY3a]|nr:hypothetical protein IQ07DRAFT_361496 [Pyrenochaeta sp. DS3sAY3a]
MPTNKGSTNSATKTKTANLERIRNNQRRCRARQKEYIAELEDKIRQYESGGSTSSTDPKLQHFIRENESLKRILQSLGLGKEFLKAYGKAAQIAPDISRAQLGSDIPSQTKECSSSAPSVDILQPNLTPTITREPQTEQEPALSTMDVEAQFEDDYQLFEGLIQVDTVPSWEPFGFLNTSTSALESLQADDQTESLIQMIGDTMRTESFGNTTTAEDISDTTTLCSSAFSLVLKNNLKGYSAADLDLKLRMGYRCGATPSEGCRVDNKILISVLAEISL